MKCPYCNNAIPEGNNTCPSCGAPVEVTEDSVPEKKVPAPKTNQKSLKIKIARALGWIGIFLFPFACFFCGVGLGLAIDAKDSKGIKINAVGLVLFALVLLLGTCSES